MSRQPAVFSTRWCLCIAVLVMAVAWGHPTHARGPDAPGPNALQTACTALHAPSVLQVSLLFGLNRPDGGHVSQRDWTHFVRDIITPRFPAGFSVLRMTGQWRDEHSGRIVREPSRIIWVATPSLLTSSHGLRPYARPIASASGRIPWGWSSRPAAPRSERALNTPPHHYLRP
ncbi:DUF3574 domain-containing protein [Komagataeibacter nataicola]